MTAEAGWSNVVRSPNSHWISEMAPLVVCLSGRIGSGKTSVSLALAKKRQAAVASFGAYIRSVASARGLDADRREVLQNLGAELIADHGHEGLCRAALSAAKWQGDRELIVDGIRHVQIFEAIKRITAPSMTLLVHLQLESDGELGVRAERRGIEAEARARLEQHSTERDVIAALPSVADLVLSAELPIEQVVGSIDLYLSSRT